MRAPATATRPFEAETPPAQEIRSRAERTRKIQAAMGWLRQEMQGQPTPASAIEAAAQQAGIARTTLQTAKERLAISSVRQGKGWVWIPYYASPVGNINNMPG